MWNEKKKKQFHKTITTILTQNAHWILPHLLQQSGESFAQIPTAAEEVGGTRGSYLWLTWSFIWPISFSMKGSGLPCSAILED